MHSAVSRRMNPHIKEPRCMQSSSSWIDNKTNSITLIRIVILRE
uniref:Uncharacterized protein n=1 Tax=Parascaris univalens TaxID=6257 RepID=A0A915CFL8_PARUN